VFTCAAAGLDLGDQGVIGDGEAAFLGLYRTRHREDGLAGEGLASPTVISSSTAA
jgi:hypothetical protein